MADFSLTANEPQWGVHWTWGHNVAWSQRPRTTFCPQVQHVICCPRLQSIITLLYMYLHKFWKQYPNYRWSNLPNWDKLVLDELNLESVDLYRITPDDVIQVMVNKLTKIGLVTLHKYLLKTSLYFLTMPRNLQGNLTITCLPVFEVKVV